MLQQSTLLNNDDSITQVDKKFKRAIEDGFPFVQISEIAEAESWRKEIYRPIYHLHKWWAQRLGSVFRAIILASVLPQNTPILDYFYQKNDLNGLVVFDPFMGSGTTIGEAIKLGCTAIGRDINPVAYNTVRAAFARVSKDDVDRVFSSLDDGVGEKIRALYRLNDGSEVLYFFWVKEVVCPNCGSDTRLFKDFIFSRHTYPSKNPKAQCVCPKCGEVFFTRYDSTLENCPHCAHIFNPQIGLANHTKASCESCGSEFRIVDAVKQVGIPPSHKLYAKMILLPSGEKVYCRITEEDLNMYKKAELLLKCTTPLIANLSIKPGYNTNQVLNYCYRRWDQFFNARQLLALTWLGKAIRDIENPDLRLVFGILFSGIIEFNNMFCSFKGEGTGAVRHMFAHHILKPERQPLEANVWGTNKSSGSFSTLYKTRLLRALEYRSDPFEVEVVRKGEKIIRRKCFNCNNPIADEIALVKKANEIKSKSVYLSCGDSSRTDLLNKSVDLIVTDPPFFDNVHYSELADFFYAWQRPLFNPIEKTVVTTRNNMDVQDTETEKFADKLAAVFLECHRVLRDNGLLVFTYHHSREEGWFAIAHAVTNSGFSFVSAHPVKSEMSVAIPKSQSKEPIDIDIILACQKKESDMRERLECDIAFDGAMKMAKQQIQEFRLHNKRLSQNDIRVILLSHLLVYLAPGRDRIEFIEDFKKLSLKAKLRVEEGIEK